MTANSAVKSGAKLKEVHHFIGGEFLFQLVYEIHFHFAFVFNREAPAKFAVKEVLHLFV